jgi:hypothetical protein
MEGRAIEVACLKVAMVGVDEYFLQYVERDEQFATVCSGFAQLSRATGGVNW